MDEKPLGRHQNEPAMADLFQPVEELEQPRPGDVRRGVITAVTAGGLEVALQSQAVGLVPEGDLSRLSPDERKTYQVGQEVSVYVTGSEDTTGAVQLSLYLGEKEQDWLKAETLYRQDLFWEGEASGYNKGGLVVLFGHIRGFVPASQISGLSRRASGEERAAHLARMVGQRVALKVVEVDRRRRRLIFSEQRGRTAQKACLQQQTMAKFHRGETHRGRVRALTDYGAFVDLDGVVGLIHRTEMAWLPVEHPCEIVQVGQEVDVYVLRVNRGKGRVSLSLKRTYADPWSTVLERYQLEQLVEGRVIRRTGGAVFVLLDDGVHGLISVSDLQRAGRPEEEVAVGRRILARLVRIDGPRRRLGLSLRHVRPAEWEEWHKRMRESAAAESGPGAEGDGAQADESTHPLQ